MLEIKKADWDTDLVQVCNEQGVYFYGINKVTEEKNHIFSLFLSLLILNIKDIDVRYFAKARMRLGTSWITR
jgi:hypothetical protein